MLYFTVLSFGGQFVAYLLAKGYSSSLIGILRTVSVVFELIATWVGPALMKQIGYVSAGLYFLSFQSLCVTMAVLTLWIIPRPADSSEFDKGTIALVAAVILSRIGLRGFDLSAQLVVQERVSSANRSLFRTVESSFLNFFELLSFGSTIIFDTTDKFFIPATFSASAVATANVCFFIYVIKSDGLAFNFDKVMDKLWRNRSGYVEVALEDEDRLTIEHAEAEQRTPQNTLL